MAGKRIRIDEAPTLKSGAFAYGDTRKGPLVNSHYQIFYNQIFYFEATQWRGFF